MLRTMKELRCFSVWSGDGLIGKLHDIYFNPLDWGVESFLCDSDYKLTNRALLMSVKDVSKVDWKDRLFIVNIIQDQLDGSALPVKNSTDKLDKDDKDESNLELKLSRETTGIDVRTEKEKIGYVEDLYIDIENWKVRYLLLNTLDSMDEKNKLIILPGWIDWKQWNEPEVFVNKNNFQLLNSPDYDFNFPLNRDYENSFFNYYKEEKYWISK